MMSYSPAEPTKFASLLNLFLGGGEDTSFNTKRNDGQLVGLGRFL